MIGHERENNGIRYHLGIVRINQVMMVIIRFPWMFQCLYLLYYCHTTNTDAIRLLLKWYLISLIDKYTMHVIEYDKLNKLCTLKFFLPYRAWVGTYQ